MTLSVEFWALPRDGEAAPLAPAKYTISPTEGDWGSISIEYPVDGPHFELLEAITADDVDLEIEMSIAASDRDDEPRIERGLLFTFEQDDVEDAGTAKLTGHFLPVLLSEVVMPYNPAGVDDQGNPNGETVLSGTAGRIARELLEAAQDRGCLEGLTWTFTDSHDSNGDPWARESILRFSPGQHYAAALGVIRGYQLGEWKLTSERELVLTNVDGLGVDRTVTDPQVVLEHGRDLGDAPRRHTVRDAVTALLSAGKDGVYGFAESLTAQGRRGRRIEGYHSFGNTSDQGTLDALTQARLGTSTEGTLELSHKLPLGPGSPLPLLDFDVSDWVLSATRRETARRRVKQVSISGDSDGNVEAAVTLNALIDEQAVRERKRLDDLESGAAVVGTSTPPPETDDGSTPDTPDDLVATSLWYEAEGPGLVSVTAAWTAVPDARVVGYLVQWRYVDTGEWQPVPQTEDAFVSWSGVQPGAGVGVRVAAVNRWGRSSTWSAEYQFTTETDGSAPAVASAPSPAPRVGQMWVTWDGRGAEGEPMPGDFLRAELHRSTTTGFTADRPLLDDGKTLDEAASTTYRGELRAGMTVVDEMTEDDYGTEFFYVLVTVDRSHNATGQSAQASAVAQPVQDGEVAGITASKILAGVIESVVGIGQRLYAGDPNGSGWEGDPSGFRFWHGTGAARRAVLEFVASTGVLSMVGRLLAGAGVGVGPTVEISPDGPRMRWYPSATQTHIEQRAYLRNDNQYGSVAALVSQVRNAAGQSNGAYTRQFAQAWCAGMVNTSEVEVGGFVNVDQNTARIVCYHPTSGDGQQRAGLYVDGNSSGGYVLLDNRGGADLQLHPSGAAELKTSDGIGGRLGLDSNGDVWLQTRFNTYLVLGPGGAQLVSNGTVKSFVVEHPLDDPEAPQRWLVHGCTEGPTAGVEYHGVATIEGGVAEVELPAYFEALTEAEGRVVHLTPYLCEQGGMPMIPQAAPTEIEGGRFRIVAVAPDGARVAWRVFATRRGAEFEVEPLRAEYDAHGDGPYRYLTRKDGDQA